MMNIKFWLELKLHALEIFTVVNIAMVDLSKLCVLLNHQKEVYGKF